MNCFSSTSQNFRPEMLPLLFILNWTPNQFQDQVSLYSPSLHHSQLCNSLLCPTFIVYFVFNKMLQLLKTFFSQKIIWIIFWIIFIAFFWRANRTLVCQVATFDCYIKPLSSVALQLQISVAGKIPVVKEDYVLSFMSLACELPGNMWLATVQTRILGWVNYWSNRGSSLYRMLKYCM